MIANFDTFMIPGEYEFDTANPTDFSVGHRDSKHLLGRQVRITKDLYRLHFAEEIDNYWIDRYFLAVHNPIHHNRVQDIEVFPISIRAHRRSETIRKCPEFGHQIKDSHNTLINMAYLFGKGINEALFQLDAFDGTGDSRVISPQEYLLELALSGHSRNWDCPSFYEDITDAFIHTGYCNVINGNDSLGLEFLRRVSEHLPALWMYTEAISQFSDYHETPETMLSATAYLDFLPTDFVTKTCIENGSISLLWLCREIFSVDAGYNEFALPVSRESSVVIPFGCPAESTYEFINYIEASIYTDVSIKVKIHNNGERQIEVEGYSQIFGITRILNDWVYDPGGAQAERWLGIYYENDWLETVMDNLVSELLNRFDVKEITVVKNCHDELQIVVDTGVRTICYYYDLVVYRLGCRGMLSERKLYGNRRRDIPFPI